jgi:hypothetical protein
LAETVSIDVKYVQHARSGSAVRELEKNSASRQLHPYGSRDPPPIIMYFSLVGGTIDLISSTNVVLID